MTPRLKTLGRLAAVLAIGLLVSACHYHAPRYAYGGPDSNGYYGYGHGGHGHHAHGHGHHGSYR